MNKKILNEAEICDAFTTPAIIGAGWDQSTQIRRENTPLLMAGSLFGAS